MLNLLKNNLKKTLQIFTTILLQELLNYYNQILCPFSEVIAGPQHLNLNLGKTLNSLIDFNVFNVYGITSNYGFSLRLGLLLQIK